MSIDQGPSGFPPSRRRGGRRGVQMSSSSSWPICRRFNKACCKDRSCRYRYICMQCQGHHPAVDCGGQNSVGQQTFKAGKERQDRFTPFYLWLRLPQTGIQWSADSLVIDSQIIALLLVALLSCIGITLACF